MADKKDDDQGKKVKKVVSIANGQPIENKPEADPYIIAILEEALKQAYAGGVDQIILILAGEDGSVFRVVEGELTTPEIMYSQLDLMKDDYKQEYLRPMDNYVEYTE